MRAVWRGPQGLAAVAVVVSMVVWRAVLLGGSFFNQDDFYLVARAYRAHLGWHFLFADTAGHLMPLQQLAFWAVAHHAPYAWGVVAGGILLSQTLSVLVCWHVLTRILPDRWARVPLLAVVCWAPMTLAPTLWWAASMGLWPYVLCTLLAVLFLLRAIQGAGPRWRELLLCGLAACVGLLWWERAVLVFPVLFGVAFLIGEEPTWWRRLRATVTGLWPLWAGAVVLLAGYLVVHVRLAHVEGGGGGSSRMLAVTWAYVGENVVPGLVGGPWAAGIVGGAVEPSFWVVVTSLLLVGGLGVLLVARCGPRARWAVVFLAGYVAADAALLLFGRSAFGRLIGLDPRYSADVVQAAVLAAALALRAAPRHYGFELSGARSWARWRTVVVVGSMGVYLVGAAFGTALLVPAFQNTQDRTYLTNIRAGLTGESQQVLYDDLVPPEVVLPLVGDDSRLSRILAPLPERPAFDQPSPDLRVVAGDGRLQRAELDHPVTARPGPVPRCGYAVRSTVSRVPMQGPLSGRVALRVDYFTDAEATVTLGTAGWSTHFRVRPGPNEMWVVVADLGHEWHQLRLSVGGPSTVCVVRLEAGVPVAR